MKKLFLTNIAYGPMYTSLFLNVHLKSLMDETNIPKHKDRLEYHLFTDDASLKMIQNSETFKAMDALIPVHIWLLSNDRPFTFNDRYGLLVHTFKLSVEKALAANAYCSAMVADLCVAQNYIEKVLAPMDAGHDSVFMLPMRTAAEAMVPRMVNVKGALPAEDLYKLAYECLHPLWVACHFRSPQFTKLPFTLLWNSGTGLLAKSYSITPIIFTPMKEMLNVTGVIDVEVPGLMKNPKWVTDAVDCPIIGIEPLVCYYPPFTNTVASTGAIRDWAMKNLHPTQHGFVERSLFYPSKTAFNSQILETSADSVVEQLKP